MKQNVVAPTVSYDVDLYIWTQQPRSFSGSGALMKLIWSRLPR